MAYLWVGQPMPGVQLSPDDLAAAGMGKRFDDQAAAETWLTLFYPELADLGVAEVSLYDEDRLVYGPMPLGD